MDIVAIILALLILLALACLLVRLAAQRKLILELREGQRTVEKLLCGDRDTGYADFVQSQPGPLITIEILNAVEVAAQSSMIGGLIGRFAPDTIHRLVVRRTADAMRSQMTEHGVEVQVLVHEPGEKSAESD